MMIIAKMIIVMILKTYSCKHKQVISQFILKSLEGTNNSFTWTTPS